MPEASPEDTVLYDRDGNVLYAYYYHPNGMLAGNTLPHSARERMMEGHGVQGQKKLQPGQNGGIAPL